MENQGIFVLLLSINASLFAYIWIYRYKEISDDVNLDKLVDSLSSHSKFNGKLLESFQANMLKANVENMEHKKWTQTEVKFLSLFVNLTEQLTNDENNIKNMVHTQADMFNTLTRLSNMITSIQEKTDYMDVSVNKFKQDIDGVNTTAMNAIAEIKDAFDQHIEKSMKSFREEIETLRIAKQLFETDMEMFKTEKQKFEHELEEFKSSLGSINESKTVLNEDLNKQKTKMHNIYLNTFNKASVIFAIILLYILYLVLVIVVYTVYRMVSSENPNRTLGNGKDLIDNPTIVSTPSRPYDEIEISNPCKYAEMKNKFSCSSGGAIDTYASKTIDHVIPNYNNDILKPSSVVAKLST